MRKIIEAVTAKIDVKEIANLIRDNNKKRIEKGINVDGSKMKALDPKTIAVKKKQGGISPSSPLIFKGGTTKGIQSQSINKKEAIIQPSGTAKGYFGGQISSKDMLKYQAEKGRDPYGVSNDDMNDVDKLLRKQLGR